MKVRIKTEKRDGGYGFIIDFNGQEYKGSFTYGDEGFTMEEAKKRARAIIDALEAELKVIEYLEEAENVKRERELNG